MNTTNFDVVQGNERFYFEIINDTTNPNLYTIIAGVSNYVKPIMDETLAEIGSRYTRAQPPSGQGEWKHNRYFKDITIVYKNKYRELLTAGSLKDIQHNLKKIKEFNESFENLGDHLIVYFNY